MKKPGDPGASRRPLKGRKIADRRVRVERPHAEFFRFTGEGSLVAKAAASRPRTPAGRFLARLSAITLGRPLASEEEMGERLSKKKALAIFSSDAISSSAYATEEILRVLILAGAAALLVSIEIAVAIAVMLAMVALSYRQVTRAFPGGGGAYAVARSELTPMLGLIAAGALLIDYVMTVAVSTSSALDQIFSIAPGIAGLRVEIGILAVVLITIGNLRGLRESGNIFAVPTYVFLALAMFIVASGIVHIVTGEAHPLPRQPNAEPLGTEALGLFLLLKAFASGSVALTGVEAIANGVQAFKPPEAKNAANTLTSMSILLGIIFIGLTIVAHAYDVIPSLNGAPVGRIHRRHHGLRHRSAVLRVPDRDRADPVPRGEHELQRVSAPRGDPGRRRLHAPPVRLPGRPARLQLGHRRAGRHRLPAPDHLRRRDDPADPALLGRGVRVLHAQPGGHGPALAAGPRDRLVVAGEHQRHRGPAHRRRAASSSPRSSSRPGAYLVIVLIPIEVAIFLFIHRQYGAAARQLAMSPDKIVRPPHRDERVVVPVPTINRAVVQAINVGRSISEDVRAVYISEDPELAADMRKRWQHQVPGVPLVIVESPYRALVGPLVAYLDVLDSGWPAGRQAPITFVVVPEYVARHWWERILYNQSAKRLRTALLGRPHTVVVNVPYRREDPIFENRAKPAEPGPDAGADAGADVGAGRGPGPEPPGRS